MRRLIVGILATSVIFAVPARAEDPSGEEQVSTTDEIAPVEAEGAPFADVPASLVPADSSSESESEANQ